MEELNTFVDKQSQDQRIQSSWLAEKFQEDRNISLSQGWPHRKLEAWKYSPVNELKEHPKNKANADFNLEKLEGLVQEHCLQGMDLLVIADGYFVEELSSVSEGLQLLKLAELQDDEAQVAYQRAYSFPLDKSETLNRLGRTLASAPLKVKVCQNNTKLQILYILNQEDSFSSSFISVEVEEGRKAEIVESFIGPESDTAPWFNSSTHLVLGQNSNLKHNLMPWNRRNHLHTHSTQVELFRDSKYTHSAVNLGGDFSRQHLHVRHLDKGSDSDLSALYALQDKTHADFQIRVEHLVPHCQSSQLYKGLLADQSKAVFNGLVYVEKGADQTEAHQLNKNLLLSPHAEVDTKPTLEIYADDVSASHGATIGQLDESQVFYLMSRAISKAKALELLSYAFVNEILQKLAEDQIKAKVLSQLQAELQKLTEFQQEAF